MRAPRLLKLAAKLMQWSLRLLLGMVLLLACAVAALHWWIVPRINDFRPQVESRLSAALGVPVRIEQLQADGDNGLVPAVAARGVQILQPDGGAGLTLPEVKVALSVPSLLRLRAEQIAVVAPQLQVQRAADGSAIEKLTEHDNSWMVVGRCYDKPLCIIIQIDCYDHQYQ